MRSKTTKGGTPPTALIGAALLLALGLSLLGSGIGSVASLWHLKGGIMGWFLGVEPSRPGQYVRNPVGAVIAAVPAILSFVFGFVLLEFGVICSAAGLVLGVTELRRPGPRVGGDRLAAARRAAGTGVSTRRRLCDP